VLGTTLCMAHGECQAAYLSQRKQPLRPRSGVQRCAQSERLTTTRRRSPVAPSAIGGGHGASALARLQRPVSPAPAVTGTGAPVVDSRRGTTYTRVCYQNSSTTASVFGATSVAPPTVEVTQSSHPSTAGTVGAPAGVCVSVPHPASTRPAFTSQRYAMADPTLAVSGSTSVNVPSCVAEQWRQQGQTSAEARSRPSSVRRAPLVSPTKTAPPRNSVGGRRASQAHSAAERVAELASTCLNSARCDDNFRSGTSPQQTARAAAEMHQDPRKNTLVSERGSVKLKSEVRPKHSAAEQRRICERLSKGRCGA